MSAGSSIARAASAQMERAQASVTRAAQRAKEPKRRIRWIETGNQLIAQVEQRQGLRWLPTNVREVVDLDVAEKAMRVWEERNGITAGDDDTAGFGDRLKKFGKRIAKTRVGKIVKAIHVEPLKLAHKVTHGKNSPIRKLELQLQKTVGTVLPFTKPFIAVHNSIANKTHKAIDKATGTKTRAAKGGNLNDVMSAAAASAGGSVPAVELPAGVKIPAGVKPAAVVKKLKEQTKRQQAKVISNTLQKLPAQSRKAAKKSLIKAAKTWVVQSPDTGITYSFQL